MSRQAVSSLATLLRKWCCAGLLLSTSLMAAAEGSAASGAAGRTPKPVVEAARGGQCVEDAAFMRRNHMQLLKHQRVDTLRGGIRTGKYSLKECISCHASQTTNSVNASGDNFCQSCHNYAAVSIDCFGCHANKPAQGVASSASPHGTAPGPVAQAQGLLTPQQVKP
jgi:hypothetical protein